MNAGTGSRKRTGIRARAARLAVLAVLALTGCGDEDDTPRAKTLGPASASGDIDQSPQILHRGNRFTTLISTQVHKRGDGRTFVAGQVELPPGTKPRFRLTVDGKVDKRSRIDVRDNGGGRLAVASCACTLDTGEHTIRLEGEARRGSARVGARTLIAFPGISAAAPGVLGASVLRDKKTSVSPDGATLARATGEGPRGGPAIVLISIRSPQGRMGATDVRVEAEVGGEIAPEIASTTLPSGKVVAFFDEDGTGEPVNALGFTAAGQASVSTASILVCECALSRD